MIGPVERVTRAEAPTSAETPSEDVFPGIDDYAAIGDCRTIALVSRTGSIEWLCLPDFGSPSIFTAILDRTRGGRFDLRPEAPFETSRRYLPNTAILETVFTTATGRARVLDFFPIGEGGRRWQAPIRPQRELIRLVEGMEGWVDFATAFDPRPDYGRRSARFEARTGFGWVLAGPGELLSVWADFDLTPVPTGALVGRFRVGPGDSRAVGLAHARHDVAVRPVIGGAAREELEATAAWWRDWSARVTFEGPRRPLVVRSAITLKLLTYALSGAVVAAATTSLPEAIGASRNWDYRFCWLRDASVTMNAFLGLGLQDEADAFLGWLLNATRLTRPELRILYDLHGRNDASETELVHLSGYRGSRPVRIGNAAPSQLQLDTYGSVIVAVHDYVTRMGPLRCGEMHLLRDFGEGVCRRWQEPDHGHWEVRGATRHYTATKVMCWAALDRLVRLAEQGLVTVPLDRFRANREAIAADIEARAFDPSVGAYIGELDGSAEGGADAAVLLMATVGYGDPQGDRMRGTLDWVIRELGRDGLIARYKAGFDGDASREGTFGICLSWAVETAAAQGDIPAAEKMLDRFARTANDIGLFAEEYDVEAGCSLGNFPQAFSHAGYVAACLAIERHSGRRQP